MCGRRRSSGDVKELQGDQGRMTEAEWGGLCGPRQGRIVVVLLCVGTLLPLLLW